MQSSIEEPVLQKLNPFSEKPTLGIPLKKFRITIKLIGRHLNSEIQGSVYDATDLFRNPQLIIDLKKTISDDVKVVYGVESTAPIYEETDGKTQKDCEKAIADYVETATSKTLNDRMQTAIDLLRKFPLVKVCRIIVLVEDHSPYKHLIIQFGRLNLLTHYATMPSRLRSGLVRGQAVDFTVTGWGDSFPYRRMLPDLGKGFIHWFVPDDESHNSEVAASFANIAEPICELLPVARKVLEIKDYKKALEGELSSSEDARTELAEQIKVDATIRDLYELIISRLTRHKKGDITPVKTHDLFDFLCYFVPTVVFALLGWGIGGAVGLFGGIIVGLPLGGFASYKRR